MTILEAVGHPLRIHHVARSDDEIDRLVAESLERVGSRSGRPLLIQVPERPVWWPKTAGRACTGDHPRPGARRRRRASLDARHERARQGARVDGRLEARSRTHLSLRHSRPSNGAKYFCDRIAIMYLGKIVEIGSAAEVYADPAIRTRRRCLTRFRSRIRATTCRVIYRAVRFRTPPSHPSVARSTRAVHGHSLRVAGRAATFGRHLNSVGRRLGRLSFSASELWLAISAGSTRRLRWHSSPRRAVTEETNWWRSSSRTVRSRRTTRSGRESNRRTSAQMGCRSSFTTTSILSCSRSPMAKSRSRLPVTCTDRISPIDEQSHPKASLVGTC